MTQSPREPVGANRPLDSEIDSDPDDRGARSSGPEGEQSAEGKVGAGRQFIGGVKELGIVVGLALLLSFLIKTFLLQAFWIPSGSMENTLVKDDRVIVTKLIPHPFDLQRGDIVVFEDPGPADNKWLKGLPATTASTVGGPLHGVLVFVGLLP